MICEKCGKEHDGSYGSGRFCSSKCARSFSASKNRTETNRKISNSMKQRFDYIEYNGKLITTNKYNKIVERKRKFLEKRSRLAVEISLSESPYNEFDTVYDKNGSDKDCYYFTQHDENNQIIKRAIVPKYRYAIECELGRKLSYNEVVHHIDNNHFNNSRSNLIVLSRQVHNQLHKGIITLKDIKDNDLVIV